MEKYKTWLLYEESAAPLQKLKHNFLWQSHDTVLATLMFACRCKFVLIWFLHCLVCHILSLCSVKMVKYIFIGECWLTQCYCWLGNNYLFLGDIFQFLFFKFCWISLACHCAQSFPMLLTFWGLLFCCLTFFFFHEFLFKFLICHILCPLLHCKCWREEY